jgi:hypothetical protein
VQMDRGVQMDKGMHAACTITCRIDNGHRHAAWT